MAKKSRADVRRGVHSRIRKKVSGTVERPRLAVFRSANHIYAQVIDDDNGKTLASASSVESKLKLKSGGNIESATVIGKTIAERTIGAGIETVVYDRGGFLYHGRVKALLEATREAGLNKHEKADVKEEKGESKKKEKPAKKTDKKKSAPKKAEGKKEKPAKKEAEEKPKAKEDTKEASAKGVEKEENKDE